MDQINVVAQSREPWNKGVLVGQKAPLKLKKIWAMRIRLQIAGHTRDLALFNLANRPQAEGLRSGQVAGAGRMSWGSRRCPNDRYAAKDPAFRSIRDHGADTGGDCAWINRASLRSEDHLFPSRLHGSQHLSTRQYARSLPLTNPKHAATARISRHGREGISYPSALPRSRHCAPMQKCSPQ